MSSWKDGELFQFRAIGKVQSPFADRFGVPRQPGLAQAAKGVLKLAADPDLKTALRELDGFSHLWIVFVFHDHGGKDWKPSIRPPRLGGNRKVGVLASRSPHRPNPIGISAVKIESFDLDAKGGPEIGVSGIDLIDGTPILDLKPYLPYADAIPEASSGWAAEPIQKFPVSFSEDSLRDLQQADPGAERGLQSLIRELLELDPRPAFQKRQLPADSPGAVGKTFGFAVLEFDVKYRIQDQGFLVLSIRHLPA